MGLGFGKNIEALRALRRVESATGAVSTATVRLASGQRINRASDDSASLAISEALKFKGRLEGAAIRNVSDGISALSIMESALESQVQLAARMQELAEQAANSIYSDAQRDALDAEYKSLIAESQRIASSAGFNNINLLRAGRDGNSNLLNLQAGISQTNSVTSVSLINTGSFGGWFDYSKLGGDMVHDGAINASDLFRLDSDYIGGDGGFAPSTLDEISAYWGGTYSGRSPYPAPLFVFTAIDSAGNERSLAVVLTYAFLGGVGTATTAPSRIGGIVYEEIAGSGVYAYSDALGSTGYLGTAMTVNTQTGEINSTCDFTFVDGGTVTIDLRGLTLRNGSTTGKAMSAIEFSGLETQQRAEEAVSIASAWSEEIGVALGNIGAYARRIESSLSILEASRENTARALSTILDADLAGEAAVLVAARIRQQVSLSILAQANTNPTRALELISSS